LIIILDASAAIEIVLQRNPSNPFENYLTESEWIIVPGLFIAEVSNVFWKYYKFGNLPLEQCEKAIEYALDLPDEYCDDRTLYREAFSLGCKVSKPVYDMFYLVLARRYNGYLLTLDKTLANEAKKQSVRVLS
jgi:predicted nucleic acid-binding protein